VADLHDPDDDGIEDSLSPAERIGDALSDCLQDRPLRQRTWRIETTEVVLVVAVVAIVLFVISYVLNGWAIWVATNNKDVTALVELLTNWANMLIALPLLAVALLAQHQSRRCCHEFELYLGEANEDGGGDATEDGINIEHLTRLLRGLRRTRLATAVIVTVGCVMGVAALTSLILVLINNQVGAVPNASWYSYLSYTFDRLAAAIPALACVVIAPRGWGRGSQLLKGDEPEEPVEDEPAPAAAS
jgi:hypothetical protein